MIKFKDLKFVDHPRGSSGTASIATTIINGITISVGFGTGMYGNGPVSDQFEIHVFDESGTIPLTSENDVLGWVDAEEIQSIMDSINQDLNFKRDKLINHKQD